MIFLKIGHKSLLVLEPGNIEKIKTGEPIVTPDGAISVAYTPDAKWLSEEVLKVLEKEQGLSVEAFDELLKKSMERPPVGADRPYHEPIGWIDPEKGHQA